MLLEEIELIEREVMEIFYFYSGSSCVCAFIKTEIFKVYMHFTVVYCILIKFFLNVMLGKGKVSLYKRMPTKNVGGIIEKERSLFITIIVIIGDH